MSPNENKVPSAEEIYSKAFEATGCYHYPELKKLVELCMREHTRLHLEALAKDMKIQYDTTINKLVIDAVTSDYLTKNKLEK